MTRWSEILGVETPLDYGDSTEELMTLRRSAGLSLLPQIAAIVLSGSGARSWCGRRVPGGDQLRPGEGRHSFLLDSSGVVQADAWVLDERDRLWVLADGISAMDLVAWFARNCPEDVEVGSLEATHTVISLEGPFAWEVLAGFDSPGVIGLPPMTFFRTIDDVLCLRAGRTGEFGYLMLVPKIAQPDMIAGLMRAGDHLDLRQVGLSALATAALENFIFWPHTEGRIGLTPLELQLQWRLPVEGDYQGSQAIQDRRPTAWTQRCTLFHAQTAHIDEPICASGTRIGRVIRVAPWGHGSGMVGLALLNRDYAHPGFTYELPGGPLQTVTAPLVTNRSLFVRPQRHSWADEAELPLLVPQVLG
jgi:glycine cleavage system aminomethyltransferase T